MFKVLHHDTVETEMQTIPRPPPPPPLPHPSGNEDGKATLKPSLGPPNNHCDSRHVRETSNRWSSPGGDSDDALHKILTSTSTSRPGCTDNVRSTQPPAVTAESPEDSSSEEESDADGGGPSIVRLQLGVWDVINQEILDSFGVYGTRGLLGYDQRARKLRGGRVGILLALILTMNDLSKQLTTLGSPLTVRSHGAGGLRPELDKQEALISLVAVQLLAACFTLPPEPMPGSLPSSFYYTRWKESSSSTLPTPNCHLPDPRLISCLGLHARYRHAPASGHHARNPSVVPPWPDLYSGPSREERLADEVCRRRRLRLQAERRGSGAATTADESDYSFSPYLDGSDASDSKTVYTRRCRCQRSFLHRRISSPGVLGWRDSHARSAPLQHRAADTSRASDSHGAGATSRIDNRNTQPRYVSHWSLRPTLRSESHPVFIQPVKELVMRRWRAIRSRFVPSSTDRGRRPRLESVGDECTCGSALVSKMRETGRRIDTSGDGSGGGDFEQRQRQTSTSKEEEEEGLSHDRAPPLYQLKRAIPLSHLPKTATENCHSSPQANPKAADGA